MLNGTGQQEYELSFDKNNWTVTPAGFFSNTYTPKDVDKVPGELPLEPIAMQEQEVFK